VGCYIPYLRLEERTNLTLNGIIAAKHIPDLNSVLDLQVPPWAANLLKDHWLDIVIAAIVVPAVAGLVQWVWLWVGRRLVPSPRPQPPRDVSPFHHATSFEDLKARIADLVPNLRGNLQITYQARLPEPAQRDFQNQVDNERSILLRGRAGTGKTREAIEILRRLEERVGESVTILFPRLPLTTPNSLPPGAGANHVVLFIDNLHLPPYYLMKGIDAQGQGGVQATDFPDWLRQCLSYFKEGFPDFRVIVTVRDDVPNRDYQETIGPLRPLLNQYRFREVTLPLWSLDSLEGLIQAVTAWRGVSLEEDTLAELVRRCPTGVTPLYVQLAVSRAREGILRRDDVLALPRTFEQLWGETWEKRIEPYPPREGRFQALSLLFFAGLIPHTPVAVALAASLWEHPMPRWWRRWQVRRHLSALSSWIEARDRLLECPEAYLPPPDPGNLEILGRTVLDLARKAPSMLTPELVNLGNFLQGLNLGNPMANLEQAITAYEEALCYRTPEAAPLAYAATQNNLGNAYGNLAEHREPEVNPGAGHHCL
jgi:hypothetical protein